jgi:hypothetical protein
MIFYYLRQLPEQDPLCISILMAVILLRWMNPWWAGMFLFCSSVIKVKTNKYGIAHKQHTQYKQILLNNAILHYHLLIQIILLSVSTLLWLRLDSRLGVFHQLSEW